MENDTAPAWPDPARPGVPLNPERDGWHWLHHPEDIRPIATPWVAEIHAWSSGAAHSPQGVVDLGYTYLGPCLTPAEVAALQSAAFASGAEAMREMAKHAVDGIDTADVYSSGERHAAEEMRGFAKFLIRALPLPPMPGQPQGGRDE